MDPLSVIQKLCKEKEISLRFLEKELGYSNGSLSKAKVISSDRILEISKYFGVSMEYIMTGQDNQDASLTQKDKRDITKDLNRIMGEIKSGDNGPLYYNGIEIGEASISLLENAIEFALKETKIENKEKYNPYKNKSR